jgi:multisubunit Na+/H+ antiporter MnhB subunit
MKKNTLKYFIDIALFIDMCSIAVIGLLMGFIIPQGKVSQSEKYFLGLHRHDWGDIHLSLSIFLLILLFFHIWLNWTWIVKSTKQYFGKHWKNAILFFCAAWLIILIIGWIVIKI